MTDLISRAMFNNENLVERKLKSCYINCEEEKDMNNFEVLQEYEKAGVPLPRLEEWQKIKELELESKVKNIYPPVYGGVINAEEQNKRLKELLKECVVIIGYADTISNNEENKKTIHELLTKIEKVTK